MLQTTIQHTITCTGIGLHKGTPATITLRPAPAGTGILFHLTNAHGTTSIIPTAEAVQTTMLATTLGKDGVYVSTVEHLLATLRGLSIDNIHIDISGDEIPIMDGSAAQFVSLIHKAGIVQLKAPRKVLRIKAPYEISQKQARIQVAPYAGFFVDYTIEFPHKSIGRQRFRIDLTPHNFAQVAQARTFGFSKDVEMLRANGLALGGSLENAIVLDEHGVINPEGLRHSDEFVRHKVLDFIGDMGMLSLPLQGKFIVHCSGHALNNMLLRELSAQSELYLEELVLAKDITKERKAAHHFLTDTPLPATA